MTVEAPGQASVPLEKMLPSIFPPRSKLRDLIGWLNRLNAPKTTQRTASSDWTVVSRKAQWTRFKLEGAGPIEIVGSLRSKGSDCANAVVLRLRLLDMAGDPIADIPGARWSPKAGHYLYPQEFDVAGQYRVVLAQPAQAAALEMAVQQWKPDTAIFEHRAPTLHRVSHKSDTVNALAFAAQIDDRVDMQPGVDERTDHAEELLREGLPKDARKVVEQVESSNGMSYRTRMALAKLSYYRGEYQGAAELAEQALALLPDGPKRSAECDAICTFIADALCLADEPQKARQTLERIFAGEAGWKTGHLRLLRRTVTNEDSLADFRRLLAPMIDGQGTGSQVALYHYSLACLELERYEEAEMTIRRRFIQGAQQSEFRERPSANDKVATWAADARLALLDLKAALNSARIDFFLISGTLLGCIREDGILGHDKDIDVGVMEDSIDKDAVARALASFGCFSIKPYKSSSLLRLQHANGVHIDLFWHRRDEDFIIHEARKSCWSNRSFVLEAKDFLGQSFLIPSDYRTYLTENYGPGWQVPQKDFETFIDTPNMTITNDNEMVWYCYLKLLEYYNQGKRRQFNKIAELLSHLRPQERSASLVIQKIQSKMNSQPAD